MVKIIRRSQRLREIKENLRYNTNLIVIDITK